MSGTKSQFVVDTFSDLLARDQKLRAICEGENIQSAADLMTHLLAFPKKLAKALNMDPREFLLQSRDWETTMRTSNLL